MEKKRHKLCIEILNRFDKANLLDSLIVIGSWSIYFYQYYFKDKNYSSFIRTRDIDFLVSTPVKIPSETDIYKLLEDIGFIKVFVNRAGLIKLKHPDLTIEFLVPERGKGSDKPYPIPQLHVNAEALRFLDFLIQNTITIKVDNLRIRLPHPAAFTLHKFLIFKRRNKAEKHDRDLEGALRVWRTLVDSQKIDELRWIFSKMHKKWKTKIIQNLKSVDESEIADILLSK